MHRISFGKKSTNSTLIHGDGIAGASSSSASLNCPVNSAHVSEAGDEIMISSGTKRTRSVIIPTMLGHLTWIVLVFLIFHLIEAP